jgi:hypothetical protein
MTHDPKEVMARAISEYWKDFGLDPLVTAQVALDAIAAQGLVVVPAEPTAEMVDAGDLALYRLRHGRRQPKPNEGLLVSYRAMLAARPGAADGQEGEPGW